MRILASNPDTLGDLVLRQPMYRALEEAGHELLLVVRAGVEPLVRYVAPAARTLVLPAEVYAGDGDDYWAQFDQTFAAARDFRPDALLVAPYRWTLFEEKLSSALPESVKRIGMSGHLYPGDPHAGAAPVSRMRFDVVAEVGEDGAEVEKNAALCAAALGAPPHSIDPRLAADDDALRSAEQILARLGLAPGGYWVACVGGTAHVSIKTWPPENWGRVLAEWAGRHGRRFLFVGLPDERPAADAVRRAMADVLGEDAAAHHAVPWLEPGATLGELLALTQLSAGYVGHDTGPMHIAAATGKPTAAVFGGGTWPRFRPAVDPSVALLVGVPCVGCGWACSFSTSHCIKRVPVDAVLGAVLDLEEGRITGREARVLEPGAELQALMIREAADYVRQQAREKADLAANLREAVQSPPDPAAVAALREELHAAHEQTRLANEAAREREAAAAQLRHDLEQRAAESQRLAATLEARAQEVARLRDDIRGITRDAERAGRNGSASGGAGPDAASDTPAPPGEAPIEAEVARLRAAVGRLDARVRELEPLAPRARRSMRQVLVDLVIGSREYPRRAPLPMPRVTIVTPVDDETEAVRETIESVLSQNYHALEYVVIECGRGGTASLVREYDDRIDRIVSSPGAGAMEAVAKAFDEAEGDVLSFLRPGEVMEPGGVMRVAEFFARRPGVNAVYAEDAVAYGDGWKFPTPPQPTVDVYHLLRLAREGRRFPNGVFVRRAAYHALGPMKTRFGRAADWELFARLARRYELRRIDGHVRSIGADDLLRTDPDYAADLAGALADFEQAFGPAGRIRCRVIEAAHRTFDAARRLAGGPRLFFPLEPGGAGPPMPSGEAPSQRNVRHPISPLTDRPPDRLLFSTRDTAGGDAAVHQVYYDSDGAAAIVHPPLPLERLAAMYARRGAAAAEVTPPDPDYRSPYARFGRGALGRLLQRLPTPYWWFNQPDFGDATGDEALHVLRGLLDAADERIRLLNVGCFDGGVLDRFKARTRWQLSGTEANAGAAAAARGKGYVVWEVAPQDAPLALPVGESFDVVFLANTIEHLQTPLLVLRRLRQLLKPGGLLVVNQPNLDSAHVDLFGPTWGHWQVPYHRVLTGRRGLGRMAELADLRVVRTRTRTLPYPACVSVQLNELGLGAVVPDTARFPDEIASRGVRLTGWSRLLWDWRGRGDYLFAALRAI